MTIVAEHQTEQAQTRQALVKVIQKDLVSELEAINRYGEQARSAEDERTAVEMLMRRDEAREHFDELISLLYYLDPATTSVYYEDKRELAKTVERLGFDFELLSG